MASDVFRELTWRRMVYESTDEYPTPENFM